MRLLLSTFALAGLAATAAAECSRDKLFANAAAYIAAQQSGKLDDLAKTFATDLAYQENNKKADVKTGLLTKALKLDHNRTTADTTQCATYTELVSTAGPYVIGTQIRYSADGSSITSLDSIVATTGSWFFNAKTTLGYIASEPWPALATAAQSPRDTLKAVGDSYLDMWRDGSKAVDKVPWGTPCERTEGSMHFSSCKAGIPSGAGSGMQNGNRRYVIDEVSGSVDILCSFGGAMPDSHEFRVENGKLRYVHTITV